MKNKIIIPLAILALVGCKEFFEEDISLSEVVLIAPANGITTTRIDMTFIWEPLSGAEWYNLRIVEPDFENTEILVLDTNLTKTSYSYQLSAGTYEWGVKALNYSSETAYSVHKLIIDTNSVFRDTEIQLLQPDKNYLNVQNVLFQWDRTNNADKYRFEVREEAWNSGNLIYARDTESDTISAFLLEGEFYWGVQGYDIETDTYTGFSVKELVIDTTQPGQPVLLLPEDSSSISGGMVTFNWNKGEDTHPGSDSLIVSTNPQFSVIILRELISDTNYATELESGEYFWRVRSMDLSCNTGPFSEYRELTITDK